MEDPEGVLSFDFEGGLENGPNNATASIAAVPSAVTAPPSSMNNIASVPDIAIGANSQPGRRSFRQTVCRHWLRSLCMKGDACGFLHQYDKARMPVCRFFRLYGECREQDCVYKHTNEDIKECNMYKLGFCPNGPDCRYRHAKLPGPPPSVEEVLQKIQQLNSYNYGAGNKFFQPRGGGGGFPQQTDKSQFMQGGNNNVVQVVAGKPVASESNLVGQQQQQGQVLLQGQQNQQQVGQSVSSGGQANQGTRLAIPLPQGISRCVQSPAAVFNWVM